MEVDLSNICPSLSSSNVVQSFVNLTNDHIEFAYNVPLTTCISAPSVVPSLVLSQAMMTNTFINFCGAANT